MFSTFGTTVTGLQLLLWYALLLLTLGVEGFALLDVLRRKPELFPAAGKRTKNFWLALTGIALAVSIVTLSPLGFLSIIGFVAAAIYLADVRPALRQVSGGGSSGPYGGW